MQGEGQKNRVKVLSQRHFPKSDFPSDNFQVATSQMGNFPSGNFPKIRLGPLRRRALRIGWARGPSAAARTGLRPSAVAGTDLEMAAREISHFGSCHLGKYPWEVASWEKSFGKVPNIFLFHGFMVLTLYIVLQGIQGIRLVISWSLWCYQLLVLEQESQLSIFLNIMKHQDLR